MHRLTSLCVRHPWLTLLFTLTITAAGGWSAFRTELAVGTDAYLGADHPGVREFDAFLERFGGGYPIVIAWECRNAQPCESVFDAPSLEMAQDVSRKLEQSPFVSRVSSPATTPLLLPSDDLGIEARQLLVDGQPVRDPQVIRRALSDPLWSRTLVSTDGRVGAIVVELASTQSQALLTVVEEIRRLLEPYHALGFRFHLVGEPVIWVAAHEDSLSSAIRVGIGTGSMLFLTLFLLLRSFAAVVASLATIGVASAWTMALLPLLGWQQSVLTSGASTLILVIGCADCVHFAARYLETRAEFSHSSTALSATTRWVLAPCFLTTATTVGAFASFAAGGVRSLIQFGVLSAVGVSMAFVLTFSVFPALLTLLPPKPRSPNHSAAWQEVLIRLARFGTTRQALVLILGAALALIGAAGIPNLRVELDPYELWGPDHPIQRALTVVERDLQRPDRVEIEVSLPRATTVEDPFSLTTLVHLEKELRRVKKLREPRSLLTLLDHTNEVIRPGVGLETVSGNPRAVGELMTLVGASAGALDQWLTLDHRRVRISAEVEELSSTEKVHFLTEVKDVLRRSLPVDWDFSVTGSLVLTSLHDTQFRKSQMTIVSASSVLVFGMIAIYLRSFPWAVLAMIPNALALLLLFGTMGHWSVNLDFGSAIVAPIAIGIAADDTIHFLTGYARERRSGSDPFQALRGSMTGVGEAVITTALALALGFLSMMTSPFPSISNIGLLGAVAIIGATVADLIVLPALIATVAGWRGFGGSPGRHA
jgi:hypothetical protein